MDRKAKLEMLQRLNEVQLRKNVMIPLFEKVGKFKDLRDCHGTNEFGIDIQFYEEIGIGERLYYGVQLKTEDISGTSGKKGNIKTIIDQAEEAHNKEFYCVEEKRNRTIDRFHVVTTGNIALKAEKIIRDSLAKHNLGKIISFWNRERLLDFMDEYWPNYFFPEHKHFKNYFNAMKTDFETIKDITAIGQKEPVPLEHIYVSLRLSEKIKTSEVLCDSVEFTIKLKEPPISVVKGRTIAEEKIERREVERCAERERVLDADRAVEDYDKLVIVGNPGSGKTTLLKHLALKTCTANLEQQERTCVPIPVTLREFSESKKDLRGFIGDIFEKYQFQKAKEFVEADLKSGKCQLLLDGFDELATIESQEKIARAIHEFIETYPKCQMIVTSRIVGYHDELRGFTKLELMEFNDKQIEQFIQNWFSETNPEKAQSMYRAIKENGQIKKLARNPLMIAIIAIIYEEDKKLPQKRAKLYELCVEVLLSKWDMQKRLKNKYPSPDKKEFILRKLAFYAHSSNKRVMTETDVIQEMLRYFSQLRLKREDAKPFLDEIWQRSYLLRQISMDSYDFLNLSFQEYFTALELREREDGLSTIIEHLPESWWEEPTLLYAGISQDATALITRIQEQVPEDIFYSNLMLFGECIADAEFTEPPLRDRIVNDLWSLYQTAEFAPLKEKAIGVLALIKPENIIDSLIKDLEAKESSVRWDAAYALGGIGSEQAIDPLLNALTTDTDSSVRGSAAYALGRIGSEQAIDPLLNALTTAKDRYVRGIAAYALGRIGSEQAIDPLLKALTTAKDRDVRGRAAYALGEIGSEQAIDPLLKAITTAKDRDVRGRAAFALGRIESEQYIYPLLKAFTKAKDRDVRVSSSFALG